MQSDCRVTADRNGQCGFELQDYFIILFIDSEC